MARLSGILIIVFTALSLFATSVFGQIDETGTETASSQPVVKTGIVTDSIFKPGPRAVALPEIDSETIPAVIPIKGAISTTTFKTIRRKVFELRSHGCKLVIFDMDTPGGLVSAAGQIVRLIRSDLSDVRTIAYVNSDGEGHGAISAGAWIAVSCDQIVMAPLTKIGDCAPIVMFGTLEGPEREKMETYIRTEFRQAAEANGYSTSLLEAMVSMHKSVYHLKNTKTGENILVDQLERDKIIGDSESAISGDWQVSEIVASNKELLTLTTAEAKKLGLCYATATSMDELLEIYKISNKPVQFNDNWSEQLVNILTGPGFTSILVLGMIFFGSIEMRTPGFGIFGGIAIACLVVLIGSRFLIGLAIWWEAALLVIGVVLLLAEFFVIPGFGVAGFSGIVCCIIGVMAMLVDNAPGELPIPSGEISMEFFVNSMVGIMSGFLIAVVLILLTAKYLPNIPIAGRLVLADTTGGSQIEEPAIDDRSPLRSIKPGDSGKLISDCRPTGKCRFGDNILVDVATDGEFLTKGQTVSAIEIKSGYVLVESKQS